MAVPARMGKVGSGTVAFGPVRYGSQGKDLQGVVWLGLAVAARMLWVGLDVVRQEVCSGMVRWGMKRSVEGQAGICRGLVRLGHIRCGSQGTARIFLEGLGNE
jgi:hypothetical protein